MNRLPKIYIPKGRKLESLIGKKVIAQGGESGYIDHVCADWSSPYIRVKFDAGQSFRYLITGYRYTNRDDYYINLVGRDGIISTIEGIMRENKMNAEQLIALLLEEH